MKAFFGLLPGQTISGFAAELKARSLEKSSSSQKC